MSLLRILPRLNLTISHPSVRLLSPRPLLLPHHALPRGFTPYSGLSAGKRAVDVKVEDLAELYASAKDEFEIAVEETSKNTIYAREDRETAREEFVKFKEAYEDALSNSSEEEAVEIKRRVGQRLRELDSALHTLDEADREEH